MSYIGTSMRICVERKDKKTGKKVVKIQSYPDDITANSRITVYRAFGIKAWPYFRQLKKPKKLKLPEPVEEKPEDNIIINSKENEYVASAEDS